MNKPESLQPSRTVKRWKKVNVWPIKGPLLLLAGILGFSDHAFHWGRAVFASGVAIIIPIIGFRDFWNESKFWIAIALLSLIQVPLAIEVHPLMEQFKFPFMLAFGIFDGLAVIAAIWWICSPQSGTNV